MIKNEGELIDISDQTPLLEKSVIFCENEKAEKTQELRDQKSVLEIEQNSCIHVFSRPKILSINFIIFILFYFLRIIFCSKSTSVID
jgi:hypothetical protein